MNWMIVDEAVTEGLKQIRKAREECLAYGGKLDKEEFHIQLDKILLALVPPPIKAEYDKIIKEEGELWYS